MNDVVIVGGGIGSLYFTYKYLQSNPNNRVVVLEKKNRLGGRVYTYSTKVSGEKYKIELGAGRFNDSHKLLGELINQFGLKNKVIPTKGEAKVIVNDEVYKQNPQKILKLCQKAATKSNIKKNELYKYSLIDVINNNLDSDEVDFIITHSPYKGQLFVSNLDDFITQFGKDMYTGKNYYALKDGLSQITTNLIKKIKKMGGRLLKNHECLSLRRENGIYNISTNNGDYHSKRLILAINPLSLQKISGLQTLSSQINKMIFPMPLYRIYAVYPKVKGKVWFHDVSRSIVDNPLKYIIPINPDSGLIMVSYTDYIYAEKMHQFGNNIKGVVQHYLRELFPEKDIPDPIFIKGLYWEDGVHVWKPGYSRKRDSKKLSNIGKNLFVMGEAYSDYQAWIEGALRSASEVLKLI